MFKIKVRDLKNETSKGKLTIYLCKEKGKVFLQCCENHFLKTKVIEKSKDYPFSHINELITENFLNQFTIKSLKKYY